MNDRELIQYVVNIYAGKLHRLEGSVNYELIHKKDCRFLQDVGLPCDDTLMLSYDVSQYGLQRACMTPDATDALAACGMEADNCLVFAGCEYAQIVMHIPTRCIMEVLLPSGGIRYVNSDVIKYVGCAAAHYKYRTAPGDKEHIMLVDALEEDIQEIDTTALERDANYWSLVCYNARHLEG